MKIKNNVGTDVDLNVPDTLTDNLRLDISKDIFIPIKKSDISGIITSNPIVKEDIINPIKKPTVLTNSNDYITLENYSVNPGFVEPHKNTVWVIGQNMADVENEAGTATIINTGTYLTTYPYSLLTLDTNYFVKVKMISENYESVWSDVVSITTNFKGIVAPVISISEPLTDTSLFPTIHVSEFSAIGISDTVKSTVVEISLTSDFLTPITFNLTTLTLNILEALLPGTDYFIRCKHFGNTLNSVWSDVVKFTTLNKTPDPVLSGNSVGVENNVVIINITNYNSSNLYNITASGGTVDIKGNNIYWKLPVITSDDNNKVESYSLYVSSASTSYGLSPSNTVKHDIMVSNIPDTADMFINLPISSFMVLTEGLVKTLTSRTIKQNDGDTDFISANGIMLVETPMNVLKPIFVNSNTKTSLKYDDSKYSPVVGDKVISELGYIFSILEIDTLNKMITIDNTTDYMPTKLYKISSLMLNGESAQLVHAKIINGKLNTLFSEIVFNASRDIIFKITSVSGNTLTSLSGGINKAV